MSEALPGVSRIRSGRPWASATTWILVVRPPRELPMAWTKAPFAPAAERCALMWILSIDTVAVMPVEPVSASNMANQMPAGSSD